MSKPIYIFNSWCVECGAVNKQMVKVGAVCFCEACHQKILTTDDPVTEEREEYLKYLHKWNTQVDEMYEQDWQETHHETT